MIAVKRLLIEIYEPVNFVKLKTTNVYFLFRTINTVNSQ